MGQFKSVNQFLLFVFCIVSIVAMSGCTHKTYYQDMYGRYYYLGTDGKYYYKDNDGIYTPVAEKNTAVSSVNNPTLVNKVMDALEADMETKGQPIHVTGLDGQIVLSGYVSNDRQRLAAVEVVRKIPGVRLVVNKISVKLF